MLVGDEFLTEREFLAKVEAGDARAVDLARFVKWAHAHPTRLAAIVMSTDAPAKPREGEEYGESEGREDSPMSVIFPKTERERALERQAASEPKCAHCGRVCEEPGGGAIPLCRECLNR